ncbi:MAG: glycosyltransferase family 2 protein [Eubacteriales bacterium]|nr:glycosyltransferase family 2 protein [Eubacteriales bacterium]
MMTETALSVSIVMPVLNGERFIRQAIESVLHQTLQSWELIVVDDGSSDHTKEIVQKYQKDDARIRLICREQTGGTAAARNEGFRCCSGKYVALLDGDDLWYPDKLELQYKAAEEMHADIIYCSYHIIDENNVKCNRDFIVPGQISYNLALVKSVMSCSTVLIRAEVVREFQFSEEFYHEDLAYWLELLQHHKKAFGIKKPLACYRIVKSSKTSNKFFTEKKRWLVYKKFCGFSAFKATILTGISAMLGVYKYRWIPPKMKISINIQQPAEHL